MPNYSSLLGAGHRSAQPGYDVVLLAGQSNIVGLYGPIDGGIDVGDPRIKQYARSGASSGTLIDAIDALYHVGGQSPN